MPTRQQDTTEEGQDGNDDGERLTGGRGLEQIDVDQQCHGEGVDGDEPRDHPGPPVPAQQVGLPVTGHGGGCDRHQTDRYREQHRRHGGRVGFEDHAGCRDAVNEWQCRHRVEEETEEAQIGFVTSNDRAITATDVTTHSDAAIVTIQKSTIGDPTSTLVATHIESVIWTTAGIDHDAIQRPVNVGAWWSESAMTETSAHQRTT